MVVDTSILLAVFFNEPFGPWALDRLQKYRDDLLMSTVNYAEALILIHDRQPHLFDQMRVNHSASPRVRSLSRAVRRGGRGLLRLCLG